MTTLPQTTPMRLPRPAPSHLAIPSANGHGPVLPHAQHSGLTGADVWRVIRANLWLIIGLVAASGVGGYFLNAWLNAHYARYTSTALMSVHTQLELPQNADSGRALIADPSPQNIELEQQSQTSMLQNRYFLGTLLEDPQSDIRKTSWFQQFGNRIEDAKQDLMEKLEISPRPGSRLIAVSMSCADPKDAQVIVRGVVEKHVGDRRQKMQDTTIQRSTNLQGDIDRYDNQLRSLHDDINRISRQLAERGSGKVFSAIDAQLSALLQQQTAAQEHYNEAQARLQTFLKEIGQDLTPKELQARMQGGQGMFDNQITALQVQLSEMMDKYGSNNDHVKALQRTIDKLTELANEKDQAARAKAIAAIRTDFEADVAVARQNADEIGARLAALQKARTDIAAQQNELAQKDEDERSVRGLLEKARDERDKVGSFIQQNNSGTAVLEVQPDLPDKPSFPKLSMTMSLAIALGLFLSLGIAFLREVMDTTVRSPRDIARIGQLNLLGLIPHEADDPQVQSARLPLAIYEAPHSVIAEQFRQVRTRLQHSASLDTVRSLLVTGTSPGDGKTTVACNLAAGLALNGRRILLVDANFRKPQIHAVFNLPNEIGFSDALNSLDAFDDAVRETEVPNLSVFTSGAKPSNPTELLESQLLIDFIERALEEYDHVIFDSGPLLIVSETAALAPRVDGVVTVVRARGNSRGLLQRLRDQLRQLKAEHLGVILNAVRSQSGGYYAPMIKSYYAYQNS